MQVADANPETHRDGFDSVPRENPIEAARAKVAGSFAQSRVSSTPVVTEKPVELPEPTPTGVNQFGLPKVSPFPNEVHRYEDTSSRPETPSETAFVEGFTRLVRTGVASQFEA